MHFHSFFAAVLMLCSVSLAAVPWTFRPPAVPLVTHDPYFSIWSASDRLTDDWPRHWTGATHALCGLARIDGKTYRFLGPAPSGKIQADAMEQTELLVQPTITIAAFEGAGIDLVLSFESAVVPTDLELLTRPVTYINIAVSSKDGKDHDVQIYFDACSEIAVHATDQAVQMSRVETPGLATIGVGTVEQPVLKRKGDGVRIDWGHLYLSSNESQKPATVMGDAETVRQSFISTGKIGAEQENTKPRAVKDGWPVLACSFNLGPVGKKEEVRRLMLAYDEEQAIEYLDQKLKPYWRRNGMDAAQLLVAADKDYDRAREACKQFNESFSKDFIGVGGGNYVNLCALSYRQALAGHGFAASADGRLFMFAKENSSNGCIGTVDVIYPAAPIFLLFSPTMMEANLAPVIEYAAPRGLSPFPPPAPHASTATSRAEKVTVPLPSDPQNPATRKGTATFSAGNPAANTDASGRGKGDSPRWKFPFAPHDLGTYPLANGQVYGGGEKTEKDQMPVEESANMLICVAALEKATGQPSPLAQKHLPVLKKWADYLIDKGLDPENQLCTDDFTGHLAHNVNLSAKAIIGIAAYGQISGDKTYLDKAKKMADQWVTMADDGDHTKLAFDKPGTWSQKYNLVWDKVLDLNLFPKAILKREVRYYISKSTKYGPPLDNRATFTKLDWTAWSACLADDQISFEALINPLAYFANDTTDRVPLSDWYHTDTAKFASFKARPVVGGVFMKMLCEPELWKKWAQKK